MWQAAARTPPADATGVSLTGQGEQQAIVHGGVVSGPWLTGKGIHELAG